MYNSSFMHHNTVLNITFIPTNVRTADCMQDKNVKLPFMYQPPVPNITKFANLGFIQKNLPLVWKKTLNTRSTEKGKTEVNEQSKNSFM